MAACTCRRALDSHHQPAVIPQVVRELVCVRRPVLKHQAAPRLGGGVGRAPVQCQRAVDAEPAGARRQPGQAHIVLPELAPGKRGLRVEEALVRGVVVEQPELVRAADHPCVSTRNLPSVNRISKEGGNESPAGGWWSWVTGLTHAGVVEVKIVQHEHARQHVVVRVL